MIYLYGLLSGQCAEASDAVRDLAGVTGPVETLITELGVLVFGQSESSEFAPKRRNLMAHARVLEACQEIGDILPMRFGMTACDEAEILETLRSNRAAIAAQFDRIAGKVEFGIKIGFPRDAALMATIDADPALAAEHRKLREMVRPPHFAAAEFGRRLAEALDRRRTDAQRKLLPVFAGFCGDYVVAAPEDDVQVLNLHALVPREMGEKLARVAQEEGAANTFVPGVEADVKLIGPEPPFHFVQVSLESAAKDAA